ncbi:exopolysaccharide biosynthesis protein [Qaidamihabitans albus]|uniref:exopolysaccharide biosynthesis protein n=1 Tax=Qaidamihabitans albus TaxID=2795733 RepID=UPI0018F158DD|nr:exopolysaccharide biosynthesis protein [Qaidamihabitans albus]
MSDDLVRLPVIGRVVRRRWRVLAVLAVVGGLLGAGASLLFSPGYETSSSVLLQGPREEDELLTEAQIATSSVVLDRTAEALGWGVAGRDLKDSVEAGVLNGNVIDIRSTAESPERAQELADRTAEEYVRFSTQLVTDTGEASAQMLQEQRDVLRQRVTETNERITELHSAAAGEGVTVESVQARTELEALRSALEGAMKTLTEAEAAAGLANMVVMGPAAAPTEPAPPTMTQLAAGGAALFALLGVLGHLVAARADRRLRKEADIAAALGSPVLGSVDVPVEDRLPTRPTGLRARARRLLRTDEPWNIAELPGCADEAGLEVRYRRILGRLRDGPGQRRPVLVVVPGDDIAAHRAAERLARTSSDDGTASTPLRVVDVAAHRPTVPDGAGTSGAVLVVTAGTRTAWELVGITEACAEAGHAVLGAVVSHPGGPVDDRKDGPRRESPSGVSQVDGNAMVGAP